MNIGNEELMHECFSKHLIMGTARMKYDRQREEDKKRWVSMERIKRARKNEVTRPKLQLRPIFPRGRYAPKQWMNFLTNLHL